MENRWIPWIKDLGSGVDGVKENDVDTCMEVLKNWMTLMVDGSDGETVDKIK